MSGVGPTALSSLLVQRLDAVLGTQLAQHGGSNAATRQDAVIPPGRSDGLRPGPQGRGADLLENLSIQDRAALREAAQQAELAAALRSRFVSTDTTPSAPTTLGQTARVILTLLAQYPDTAPALAGKAPLWAGAGDPDGAQDGAAGAPARGAAPGPQAGEPRAIQGPGADDGAQPDLGQHGASAGAGGAAGQAKGAAAPAQAPGATLPEGADPSAARTGAGQPGNASQAAAAASAAALQPGTPQAGALAQALRQAIEGSGLFYESHLSDVAYGQRSAGQVRAEPQARLDASQAPPINTPVPKQSILADNPRFNLPTQAAPLMAQADGLPSTGTAPTWSASMPATPPAPPPGIHPDAALLVRQQLEVLANQTLAWEGTAWPGTDMWWEIRREPREPGQATAPEAPAAWATRLVLTMPRLGTVEARLSLSGQTLGLQIVAPEGESEIAAGGAALRQRLQAAGLELSQLTVSAHAPALEPIP
ncbi:flagellar hook-length control protein FliK [Bordetella flabilis]|uniref:Flagellar hook-length control protein-like C-terminal domain-containing protein n=1 Tax=Bordetella flabilis TaxID=463014 RepID=A0A193GEP0_9BORD|nr:flagellar hook-length control protein FliK [Bordetella flabilis]ANN78265.1 hypothetical protein BAU07_15175 [Bordetella flabilis]